MNEFEKLEAQLKQLQPLPPSEDFTSRLEKALGGAGNVAIRCLPDEDSSEEVVDDQSALGGRGSLLSFPRLLAFAGFAGVGLAAVWAVIFYLSGAIAPSVPSEPEGVANPQMAIVQPKDPPLYVSEDPDSPLHGLSLEQIQDISVMPVSGWLDPQINERFLRVVDEGIFDRPGGLPVRRVRHFFLDETLWSHPASDTRILSTTPREEVILIELETY